MNGSNKEVRVTFRGVDKTREAFGRIKQSFKQLQDQIGKVSFGFGKISGAITAAFSAAALKKIIDSGAEIGKLSNKLDISNESLSQLKYAAERCGVEFNTLTSGMQEMNNRIFDAARGSGEANNALSLLGLSAKELNQIAPNQQLSLIAEELQRVTNEADRTNLAMKIFGSSGASLLPILEQGASGIKALQEEAKKLGLSLSHDDCDAMIKFKDELTKLQAVLTGLMTSVLVPVLPVITAFFEAIRNGHPAITFIITAITSLLALRLAMWFINTTIAVRAFTVALMANPLSLIAVAISATIAGLVALTKWFKQGEESAKDFNETLTETKALTAIVIPKQSIETLSKCNELQHEAKRIFEQTRTPLEKHNEQMEKLNNLLKQGLIDQDTFNRAMTQSLGTLEETADKTKDVFDLISDHSKDAATNLIDNFAEASFGVGGHVKSLKETFSDFFKQMQADMLKMTLKQGLFGSDGSGGIMGGLLGMSGGGGMIGGGLGGNMGSMFAGCFARGGTAKPGKAHIVGDGGEPELFIPNSVGSIIPASKLESAAGSNINVNMNVHTPDISSFNYSRSQIISDLARQISRASRNL